jgi:alpha-glucosidase (family GH31 glycosyl hydrolase)
MLGDSLLVAAFTDRVRLPAGRWIDYWTGQEYTGPREMACTFPPNRGGPLFIKAGAIIPYWPEMDYAREKLVETIQLQLYPEGVSEFALFEDDGNSLEYLKGAVAKTTIRCAARKATAAWSPSAAMMCGSTWPSPSRSR